MDKFHFVLCATAGAHNKISTEVAGTDTDESMLAYGKRDGMELTVDFIAHFS